MPQCGTNQGYATIILSLTSCSHTANNYTLQAIVGAPVRNRAWLRETNF